MSGLQGLLTKAMSFVVNGESVMLGIPSHEVKLDISGKGGQLLTAFEGMKDNPGEILTAMGDYDALEARACAEVCTSPSMSAEDWESVLAGIDEYPDDDAAAIRAITQKAMRLCGVGDLMTLVHRLRSDLVASQAAVAPGVDHIKETGDALGE